MNRISDRTSLSCPPTSGNSSTGPRLAQNEGTTLEPKALPGKLCRETFGTLSNDSTGLFRQGQRSRIEFLHKGIRLSACLPLGVLCRPTNEVTGAPSPTPDNTSHLPARPVDRDVGTLGLAHPRAGTHCPLCPEWLRSTRLCRPVRPRWCVADADRRRDNTAHQRHLRFHRRNHPLPPSRTDPLRTMLTQPSHAFQRDQVNRPCRRCRRTPPDTVRLNAWLGHRALPMRRRRSTRGGESSSSRVKPQHRQPRPVRPSRQFAPHHHDHHGRHKAASQRYDEHPG